MNEQTKLLAELAARIVAAEIPTYPCQKEPEELAVYAVAVARAILKEALK